MHNTGLAAQKRNNIKYGIVSLLRPILPQLSGHCRFVESTARFAGPCFLLSVLVGPVGPPKMPGSWVNIARPNVRRNATQAFEHHRALCHFILFWFFEFDTSCPIWRVLVFGKCVPAKFGWRTVMSFHF